VRLVAPLAPCGLPLTPEDLGKALSCVPRWNGGTICPWSVLHHSIVCMAAAQKTGYDAVVVAYAGLHDAEEIYTGDIPRPYKTEEQSDLGRGIRAKIFASYGLPVAPPDVWETVKMIDDRVLQVERSILTHPRFRPAVTPGEPRLEEIADMIWDTRQVDPWVAAKLYGQTLRECFESKEMRDFKEMN
jgi:hypothetical protein